MATKNEDATYRAEVAAITDGFKHELCHECGGDIGDHVISKDPLGHAQAWCTNAARNRRRNPR